VDATRFPGRMAQCGIRDGSRAAVLPRPTGLTVAIRSPGADNGGLPWPPRAPGAPTACRFATPRRIFRPPRSGSWPLAIAPARRVGVPGAKLRWAWPALAPATRPSPYFSAQNPSDSNNLRIRACPSRNISVAAAAAAVQTECCSPGRRFRQGGDQGYSRSTKRPLPGCRASRPTAGTQAQRREHVSQATDLPSMSAQRWASSLRSSSTGDPAVTKERT
jgi:hypothetical protein